MTDSQRILLELIKFCLHPNYRIGIPKDVNWQKVYDEAEMQNLVAVSWDAVNKLQEDGRFPVGDEESMQMLIMRWFGMSNLIHKRYPEYCMAIKRLSHFFNEHNLSMMVMKGFGCSLNYPNPSSRPCGDIDIWMFGRGSEADEIIRGELHTEVNINNEHHSVFQFNHFTVENHGMIMDDNIHRSDKYINKVLVEAASEDVTETAIDGIMVRLPSVKFNSIHLLRHMACDFATFTTSLRHVIDWATFVGNNSNKMNWSFVYKVAHKSNMNRFLDAINGICVEYLGYPMEMLPVENSDEKLRERVLDDILNNVDKPDLPNSNQYFFQKLQYGFFKTSRLWRNRWKYHIVYNESIFESFSTLAINRLKH